MTTPLRAATLTLLLAAAGACGDSAGSDAALTLRTLGGNQQSAPAGAWLPAPLQVAVATEDGTPVVRARVAWDVTGGSGAALSDSVTVSDGTGMAQVFARVGPAEGSYVFRGRLTGATERVVAFDAVAKAALRLDSLQPSMFAAGQHVTLHGSGLTSGTRIEIAGAVAPETDADAAGAWVGVTAPPCRPSGSVTVRAVRGSAVSNQLEATYQSSDVAIGLGVGDYVTSVTDQSAACWTFAPAGDAGVELLVAVQGLDPPGDDIDFRLATVDAPVTGAIPLERDEPSPRMEFEGRLRSLEEQASQRPRGPPEAVPAPALAAASPLPVVGERRSFRVCSVITCDALTDFALVEAEVHYVGEHGILLQDLQAPSGGYTRDDLARLGRLFDEQLYDVDTRAFGAEPDVDGNGRVLILFTPRVNQLTPKLNLACAMGYVTGFYFWLDVDPGAANDPRSNQAEILYVMVPDSAGQFSCPHRRTQAEERGTVTLVHELQHMINFYQHVLLRGGNAEATWLNEGLSHTAEYLAGARLAGQGDPLAPAFAEGDLSNAYGFLEAPWAASPIYALGVGRPSERGGTWLLLRWLTQQYGETTLRRLTETAATGLDNLSAAAGAPADRLLPAWLLANYVSDLPGFTPAAALTYGGWSPRAEFAVLHARDPARYSLAYPLEPPTLGTAFDVQGTLAAGGTRYFRVVQAPAGPAFAFALTQPSGEPIPVSSRPSITVLRIR